MLKEAIENVNTIDERRSKNVSNRAFYCHFSSGCVKWQSKTPFLAPFDPRSRSVKSVLDCHLSFVKILLVKVVIVVIWNYVLP